MLHRILIALSLLAFAPALAADSREELAIVTTHGRHIFRVEIADDPDERMQGLMFRKSLAPDAGMLFLSGRTEAQSFWMKNTEIPLDLLFIAKDGRIADLHERSVPFSLQPIASKVPVWAVLEVAGGTVAKLGVKPGDRVEHRAFHPAR
jgi:uncharacterized membrane protein (UPF0127 family)